jgi:protein-disulfide isomerase/uncharacterized membrane protein
MNRRLPLFPLLLTGVGIVLSLLSATELCNFGGCTEAHQYRFWGFGLPMLGVGYFVLLALVLALPPRITLAETALGVMLAGGAGAEVTLIHLQKNIIKAWCPLCLGIAAVVYILCIMQLFNLIRNQRRSFAMKRRIIAQSLLLVCAMLAGFLVSFAGISKPAAAAGSPDISLGKQKGPVEVYLFSDWFCPVCVKIEPVIEALYPTLLQKARVTFVDKAVHPEAMNFVPYHISFAALEKDKYLQLRRALFAVASKTKNPTPDDIKAAIAPLKVTYRQLSFMEVTQQMGKFQALAEQFKVTATPTMVITNSKTNKTKTLVGGGEITTDGILKALKSVE